MIRIRWAEELNWAEFEWTLALFARSVQSSAHPNRPLLRSHLVFKFYVILHPIHRSFYPLVCNDSVSKHAGKYMQFLFYIHNRMIKIDWEIAFLRWKMENIFAGNPSNALWHWNDRQIFDDHRWKGSMWKLRNW